MSLEKVKKEAWKFYTLWRSTDSYSPAFKSKVKVSLRGWRHISGATGSKKRTHGDTYRRFKLLPYAKEITEASTTIQNITVRNNVTFYALEAIVMVKEDGNTLPRKVRVVFVDDKKGNKVFLSVMDKKPRPKKKR